jgi:hypothetical protein
MQQKESLKQIYTINESRAGFYTSGKKYEDELHTELRKVENSIVEGRRNL